VVTERSDLPVVSFPVLKIEEFFPGYDVNRIVDMLPYIGLDIEYVDEDEIRVEYSPNRPDFSSYYGIARSLKGLLEIEMGIPNVNIVQGKDYVISVNKSVSHLRPFIVGLVAKNGSLDDESIKNLVGMQEDLHNGLGRRRAKASIGFHDLSQLEFPLRYDTVSSNASFSPLEFKEAITIAEILRETDAGRKHGKILGSTKIFPVLLDASDQIISLPPIINGDSTKINRNSRDLFVEATGTNLSLLEDVLAIMAITLSDMKFDIESVVIIYGKESIVSPNMQLRKFEGLELSYINNVLGIQITPELALKCLNKSRLDGLIDGCKITCNVPRYRTDISEDIDLVEDIGIGYGIFNLDPSLPAYRLSGKKSRNTIIFEKIRQTLVGMGLIENVNFSLVSRTLEHEYVNRDNDYNDVVGVIGSKSEEHEILRSSLLPSLLRSLSHNIHEEYPQRLFEIGKVFSLDEDPVERWSLCSVIAHDEADYTEAKSIVQTLMGVGLGKELEAISAIIPTYLEGRGANLYVADTKVGVIGEITPSIIENFKIRVPIAAFEIDLTKLVTCV
jgi:phenylalanyl-tRNA synthetase beta chain